MNLGAKRFSRTANKDEPDHLYRGQARFSTSVPICTIFIAASKNSTVSGGIADGCQA